MKEFFTSHETRFIINHEIRRGFYELYEEENHYSICNVCLGNDIVNIGLHFILKNVRPYAASCSEA